MASKLPNRVVRSRSVGSDEASFGGPSLFAFTFGAHAETLILFARISPWATPERTRNLGRSENGAAHWENHPTLRQSSAPGAPHPLTRLPAVAFPWSDHYVCNEAIVLQTVTKYEDRAPSSLSVGPVVRPSGRHPATS